MLNSTKDQNVFQGTMMVLVPEEIFLTGDELTNNYIGLMIDLFDECTQRTDFIVNNTEDTKFLDVMAQKHPECFDKDRDQAKSNYFAMLENMGHSVDRTIDTVTFKTKIFWFFNFKRSARLVNINTDSKVCKKLLLLPSNFILLYYISFILCSVFDSWMIKNINQGHTTLEEMFQSPWIRTTYMSQFGKLLNQIEAH